MLRDFVAPTGLVDRKASQRSAMRLGALAAAVITIIPFMVAAMELDRIIAVVDEDVVMRSELEASMRRVRAQLRQQGTSPPPTTVLERQIMERLILEKIQVQVAAVSGVEVRDERLDEAIVSIARKNNLTLSQFKEILEDDGYQFSEFREEIRKEILISKLVNEQVDRRVRVSDKEIDNYLSNEAGNGDSEIEYRLAHILISIPSGASGAESDAARERAKEAAAQLRSGMDFGELAIAVSDGQTALEGGDLGWRQAEEVPSLLVPFVADLEIGESSGLITSPSGYHIVKLTDRRSGDKVLVDQTLVSHILVSPSELVTESEAQNRLKQLKIRLEGGDDFAALARTHSDDRGSALQGGSLGWVSPGKMLPEFDEVMTFTPIGDISHPFRTEFGWHILTVIDRRQYDGTEEIRRQKARKAIRQRKKDERMQGWLRRLRDEAYVEFRLDE
jgi:peptidyl-prolyl cis-trans isomerase SurA